jgi:uncharacterized membrane protein
VHYPISFLGLSYILDIAYGAATHPSTAKLVSSVYDVAPYLGEMARFSHYLNIIGLLTAVPAVLTGGQQLMTMIKKQDLAAKFEKSQNKTATAQKMHPKLKLGFAHAIINDAVFAGSAYNWWAKRSAPGHAPDEMSLYISAGLLVSMATAAYFGGSMVYDHGVGVRKQREAKGPKAQ